MESKDPDKHETVDDDPRAADQRKPVPWPVRRGGAWLLVYENSLLLAFVLLFLFSVVGHVLGGAAVFNAEAKDHGHAAVSVWSYVPRITVLVRVVPELAERIPCCVRDRHVVDLPPSARLAGIEAGRGLHAETGSS